MYNDVGLFDKMERLIDTSSPEHEAIVARYISLAYKKLLDGKKLPVYCLYLNSVYIGHITQLFSKRFGAAFNYANKHVRL